MSKTDRRYAVRIRFRSVGRGIVMNQSRPMSEDEAKELAHELAQPHFDTFHDPEVVELS